MLVHLDYLESKVYLGILDSLDQLVRREMLDDLEFQDNQEHREREGTKVDQALLDSLVVKEKLVPQDFKDHQGPRE